MCLQSLKDFCFDIEAKIQDRQDMSTSDQMRHQDRRKVLLQCVSCPNTTADCETTPKAEYETCHSGPTESVIQYNLAKERRVLALAKTLHEE